MKFVWATRETPLIPTLGAYNYSNGLLRSLLATGAEGRLVSYSRPDRPPGQADGLDLRLLPPPRVNRALSLVSTLPSDAYRLRAPAFARALEVAVTPDVDAVMIDFYAMGWVLPLVERIKAARRGRPLAIVYVSHQVEQVLRAEIASDHRGSPIMGAALRLDAVKAGRLERRLITAADLITANTSADEAVFRRAAPGKPVITLTPAFDGPIAAARVIDAATPRRVIYSGSLEWIAKKRNFQRFLDAADAPFRAAGIELLVAGRTEPAFAAEMQRRSSICSFTGEVPDVAPYMAQGRIGVMPDEVGGGFKNKLLDYIFGGLPIAAIGAQVEGLPLDRDHDMILRAHGGGTGGGHRRGHRRCRPPERHASPGAGGQPRPVRLGRSGPALGGGPGAGDRRLGFRPTRAAPAATNCRGDFSGESANSGGVVDNRFARP